MEFKIDDAVEMLSGTPDTFVKAILVEGRPVETIFPILGSKGDQS